MRMSLGDLPFACIAAVVSLLSMSAAQADEAPLLTFSVEAQEATKSIPEFARQAGIQISAPSEQLKGKRTPPVHGKLSTEEALKQLLEGTGLTFEYVGEGLIAITAPRASVPAGSFRLAQADAARPETSANDAADVVEEIVVTAQKRLERLRDVPVPVSAVSGDSLVATNRLRLQDYFSLVPGFSASTSSVGGYQLLSIRGITTGLANPTVGVVIDDVPYGSSTVYGGNVPPDIDPGDLARIEVLRGPQGTLYGASSIGGLLKFVTLDPSFERLTGRVQGGLSSVRNGDSAGYNVRGSVNVPLSDRFALRASAFNRRDPGYIDNPVLGIDGINEVEASGGRLAALWQLSDSVSLKLSALTQKIEADGAPDVNVPTPGFDLPPLDELQQSYIPGTGGYETKIQAYSATLSANLGSVELQSLTGYNVNEFFNSVDFSFLFGPLVAGEFGVSGSPVTADSRTNKFTQELRLSGETARFDWLVGAFYTKEDSDYFSAIPAVNPASGEVVGFYGTFDQPTDFEEYAAFANLTFHLTDRFDVQVGGRRSRISQTNQTTQDGPFVRDFFPGLPIPDVGPTFESRLNSFTYLLTPQFRISPNTMTYLRLASGYRAGGPNPATGVPPQYSPDKTYTYELGIKGSLLGGRVSYDASLYNIDWKDIQVTLFEIDTGFSYTANVGEARSRGLELSVEARPASRLQIAAWVALNDAELTRDFPQAAIDAGSYGAPGDRLPYAARVSGSVSLDWTFPLPRDFDGFLGGTTTYVGNRVGNFQGYFDDTPLPRQRFPGYAQTSLRAGLRSAAWSASVYASNVFDKRGVLDGGIGTNIPFAFQYIQPRTFGINVVREF